MIMRKNNKWIIILIFGLLMTGCGLQSSYIEMARSRIATTADSVYVFDKDTAPANYTVLGRIHIHAIQDRVGTKWWPKELKKKAAENGANGVIIEKMSTTGGFGRGYIDVEALAIIIE